MEGFRELRCCRSESQLFCLNIAGIKTIQNNARRELPDTTNPINIVKKKSAKFSSDLKVEGTLKEHPTVCSQSVASARLNTSQRETASPAAPAAPAVVGSMSATRPTSTTQTGRDNVGRHGWQAKSPCLLCGREPCAPSRTG